MNTTLTIYFPKQSKDYKEASRLIRQSNIFKEFVLSKSKDRRYLYLDFKTKERYNILKPILLNTLTKLDYDVDEVTS